MYYWDTLIDATDEPIGSYRKLKEKIEKMGYKTYEVSNCSFILDYGAFFNHNLTSYPDLTPLMETKIKGGIK